VAGGLVILSYFLPSGDVVDEGAKAAVKPEVWEKSKFKRRILADDVVIVMDARTGKTRWKRVFAGRGRNLDSGKRNIWGSTPLARDGRVYAQGSCGALCGLDLRDGAVIWQTPNDPELEAARAKALGTRSSEGVSGPTGWLMAAGGVLVAPFKTGISPGRGGVARGFALADGKKLWEAPVHPNLLAYGTVGGKACLLNTAICIDIKTGAALWQQKPPADYLAPPVAIGPILISYTLHPKSADTKQPLGLLAGFAADEKGAKPLWKLPERYQRPLYYDVAYRGLLYAVDTATDTPGVKGSGANVALIVRPEDGTILASRPCEGLSLPFIWDDRHPRLFRKSLRTPRRLGALRRPGLRIRPRPAGETAGLESK
jgi:hypothetical protein